MSSNGATPEDGNPHLKLLSLFDEHMFLGRKEPKQIATTNLVSPAPEQINSASLCNQVELQFGVMVRPVGIRKIRVTPDLPIERRRKL
jgi:hypothetical protein